MSRKPQASSPQSPVSKRSNAPASRLRGLQALAAVMPAAKAVARSPSITIPISEPDTHKAEDDAFRAAMRGVKPLAAATRANPPLQQPAPEARQRARDEAAVLVEAVSDEIDVDALLDTDDALSYRRAGIGPDVLRKLRRGTWVVQAEIDLHGHRVDEARAAVGELLREAVKRGLRCVRIVHGKGLGSKDRVPVLKGKVRAWLVQREEVIAFCQARPADGGGGALIVLLRPSKT